MALILECCSVFGAFCSGMEPIDKAMIDIIPALVTPAMLALSPLNEPAPVHSYDWQAQRTVVTLEGVKVEPVGLGTLSGTRSYVGQSLTIDDWNQD